MEASEAVGLIIESLSALGLQEDRLVALVEAGQVRCRTIFAAFKSKVCYGSVNNVNVCYLASEAVGLIIESLSALGLQEDRLVALVEAGQVRST
jgi:autonomous glycyl radical cofactor GrcA